MNSRVVNYFRLIPTLAKVAWLVFGLAKICGVFCVVVIWLPHYRYLIKILLPMWIILLIIAVILALKSRKYEPEMKEWWRYYIP